MTDESITERIQKDMTAAMKARDADTLSTLRMLKAALMEARTKKPKDAAFSRDEEIEVVQRYAKKRRETIEELRRIGREDLVASEEREIAVTQRYLPQMLTEDEVRRKYVDQVPMRRPCVYEDVCNVVAFLASDAAGYMTGQAINVTGGQEMR